MALYCRLPRYLSGVVRGDESTVMYLRCQGRAGQLKNKLYDF